MAKKTIYKVTDNCGEVWIFNGERLYCEAAEKEFEAEGLDVEENGYFVDSWGEALKTLVEDGYLGTDFYVDEGGG